MCIGSRTSGLASIHGGPKRRRSRRTGDDGREAGNHFGRLYLCFEYIPIKKSMTFRAMPKTGDAHDPNKLLGQ